MAVAEKVEIPYIRDPFAVIPMRPENVETRRDSRGMIHLRCGQELTGWMKRIADILKYDYSHKIELDENGSFYYAMIDGETTLETIVKRFIEKLQVNRKEAEEAVMLFTKKLMTQNMIALKVPECAQARRNHE